MDWLITTAYIPFDAPTAPQACAEKGSIDDQWRRLLPALLDALLPFEEARNAVLLMLDRMREARFVILTDSMAQMLDAVRFARERFGFDADPLQKDVLNLQTRRGILNCSRQWGKSTITALKAVHRAEFHPESVVIVVSPSTRQSGEFVRKAAAFVRKLGYRPRGDGDNEISLLFPNGSRIIGLPGNEVTTRGFSAVSLMLIDEAAGVPDEIYHALTPMLATSGGHLWLMSTPRGKQGFFYDEWEDGGDSWVRVRATGPECPRIPAAFLEEERQRKGEARFRQEYLCDFVSRDGALFEEAAIRKLIVDDFGPLVEKSGYL